ncbi:uncharacterized protein C8Q71DRAFT_375582 [Rhodofomes roseus]|uniref:Secreted protein n=1 Tax=Rhodofomes roseus TaxID=34475 RepID=A0ABQ8K0Y0_9APHY|nr:uncharacterized protein C8Q71DRAFT_375582 [Rhodofomes roseus]KAH9830334.1 hypothetical protein C8Q71DRAFT_375582 [Rhodofomes roseus]
MSPPLFCRHSARHRTFSLSFMQPPLCSLPLLLTIICDASTTFRYCAHRRPSSHRAGDPLFLLRPLHIAGTSVMMNTVKRFLHGTYVPLRHEHQYIDLERRGQSPTAEGALGPTSYAHRSVRHLGLPVTGNFHASRATLAIARDWSSMVASHGRQACSHRDAATIVVQLFAKAPISSVPNVSTTAQRN